MTKILFSFSLYGNQDKYTKGMIANCQLIKERFPSARIIIFLANDVPAHYGEQLSTFSNVTIKHVERKRGLQNSYDRFEVMDEPDIDIVFFRDADSRVNERDACCIEDFINDSRALHIIRDHAWQTNLISAGMFGLRKSLFPYNMGELMKTWLSKHTDVGYGSEERFLAHMIYPQLRHSMLVHDRSHRYRHELTVPFRSPIINSDFIGQTHDIDADGNVTLKYPENP